MPDFNKLAQTVLTVFIAIAVINRVPFLRDIANPVVVAVPQV